MEKLVIAGHEFSSRLFLGTGKFNSNEIIGQSNFDFGHRNGNSCHETFDMDNKEDDNIKHIIHPNNQLLPNISGVRDTEEAMFTFRNGA